MSSNRSSQLASSWLAMLGVVAVSTASDAQEASSLNGQPRSVNERLTKENPRIPSATGDANRIEAQQGRDGLPVAGNRDVAMLVEHAVGMAIEGSSLNAIAGKLGSNASDLEAVRQLRDQGRKMMVESQTLLGQASGDSRVLSSDPIMANFQKSANQYITTLTNLQAKDAGEIAQIAMVNQAVKDVLDADHIRQMSSIASGSPSIEQLRSHASEMKTQGMAVIRRLSADGSSAVAAPVSVMTLASRARQLVESAEAVGRQPVAAPNAAQVGPDASGRPDIIGGTYSNGSARIGTYNNLGHAPGSTLPPAQSDPSPVPNNSSQTTGSTGGLKPR